ncbi:oligogalacturonate lyase family protein [Halocatena halophila]|uniref:oligogalacturonate lyase family protein n=1 Tax=Halocatena halophila TaxID=2814576 RepID=UPI002ED56C19
MTVHHQQGPRAGTIWQTESNSFTDPNTGAPVRQLTTHPAVVDRHLYFTTDGWYDDGNRLLCRSDRTGEHELFSIDLRTDQLTQLTDLPVPVYNLTRVNETTNEVYFTQENTVVALELSTLSVRTVATRPERCPDTYHLVVDDVLADDERLLLKASEPMDVTGFDARRAFEPHTELFTVPIDGDEEPTLVHEENCWISHVNASPTQPSVFTFCHEGPWDHVDNRIHVRNLAADTTYRLRETADDEAVGHEFWLRDGEHVGYHGWRGSRTDGERFFGTVRYDDTDRRETPIPVRETHCHAITRDRFVCDGSTEIQGLLVYEYDEKNDRYRGPRRLATHSWDPSGPHPHARMSPDGSAVAFDGDPTSGCDIYLVECPSFDSLAPLEGSVGE